VFKYLAITSPTAVWATEKAHLIDAFTNLFISNDLSLLAGTAFNERSLNITGDKDGLVLTIWHDEYLTGTGEEPWAFIRFDQNYGLLRARNIIREAFRREMAIASQRHEGLLIEQAWFWRSRDNGACTLTAGGGDEARVKNLAYYESDVTLDSGTRSPAIILVGPEFSLAGLAKLAKDESAKFPALARLANRAVYVSRRRPVADSIALAVLRESLKPQESASRIEATYSDVGINMGALDGTLTTRFQRAAYTYDNWLLSDALTPAQRRLLQSDIVRNYPVRIIGPAGSGKTLLMQLLAIGRLREAAAANERLRLLYITHNAAMAENVISRFETLGAESYLYSDLDRQLFVDTLSGFTRRFLGLDDAIVIDIDAYQTKEFQFNVVKDAFRSTLEALPHLVAESELLTRASTSPELFEVFSRLIMTEISVAIKGHQLVNDPRRYIESEQRLSRFHGALKKRAERQFIFEVFRKYHHQVFVEGKVLDADDLAISLFSSLRTPIWELRRRDEGYSHVFVDETQLFNENERRLFPLLTRGTENHIPVVVALDDAQDIAGQSTAGFGVLGLSDIQDETLAVSQRSTKWILELAFFVVERTRHLLETGFPQFPESSVPNEHPLAAKPSVERYRGDSNFPKFVLKRIRELRGKNVWQIAVVVHAETYWEDLVTELRASDLPLQILLQRGDRIAAEQPVVVLTRPAYVGGQEFDAVIAVGLEEGLVPPRLPDGDGLTYTLEEQAYREMYVSFTRARYRVIVAVPHNARVTAILQKAVEKSFLDDPDDLRLLPV
jgi:superfamily I DNA/RNA helicase